MEISTEIDKEQNIRSHVVKGALSINELTAYLQGRYSSLALIRQ